MCEFIPNNDVEFTFEERGHFQKLFRLVPRINVETMSSPQSKVNQLNLNVS